MGGRRALTAKEEAKLAGLLGSGMSPTKAGDVMGCSRGAVRNFLRRQREIEAAKRPAKEHGPLPAGANESDLAIRLELRDELLERIRQGLDDVALARLTRELNVTLDGIRRARAIPVAEEDFADEDAEWVLKKLRALRGDAPDEDEETPATDEPNAVAG